MESGKLLAEVDSYISQNAKAIFNNFLQDAGHRISKADDSSIGIVRISFLRGSAIDDSPWFRIDCYGHDDYASLSRLHFYCGNDEIIQLINAHKPVQQFYDGPSKKEKMDQEFKLLKQHSAEYFHESLMRTSQEIINEIDVEHVASYGVREVFYGDYLGKCIKLL